MRPDGSRVVEAAAQLAEARVQFAQALLLNATKYPTIKQAEQAAIEDTGDVVTVREARLWLEKVQYERSARQADGPVPGPESPQA